MSGFADVYQRLCEQYPDERDRGRAFEPLVTRVLRTDPLYQAHFAEVWPWNEWPGRDGGDIGIDIVAKRHDGGLAAIQCKCQDRIDKHHIDSFLSESQRRLLGEPYVERYIFTTATDWSYNAERAISRIDPPVQRVDFFGLDGAAIEWDAYLQDETASLSIKPRKRLRPHQVSALNDVIAGFEANDRGKLIMACGTGKTLTALRIAEQVAGLGGRVLFAAPSLSLLAQSMREWGSDAESPLRAFAVCSDTKVGRNDGDSTRAYDMPIPATTNAKDLVGAAKNHTHERMTVVFTTYQSMQVVADAHKSGLPMFDLVVCDEAHRTTGALRADEGSSFLLVHDNNEIHTRKRLYMTATPRIYAESAQLKAKEEDVYVASMDNELQYGPEFHRLSFAKAVEADLLSDYKVTILAMSEKQIARDYQGLLSEGEALADVGRVIGCLNGLAKIDPQGMELKDDPEPMHRAVAFSNTIKESQHFVGLLEREQDEAALAERNLAIEGKHVDGKSGVLERDRLLSWLREDMTMAQRCHVLSNVRCLTEGIDVPALDAVLFLQPRKSQIDVVQAVGRVMRKAEGKHYGYVVLPVVVPSGDDPERVLDRNDAYSHVWQVLQALRAHDERFDAYVNKLELNKSNDGPISIIGVGSKEDEADGVDVLADAGARVAQGLLDFDLGELRNAIIAQIVKRCGERRYWEKWADSVTDIARRHDERIHTLIESPGGGVSKRFDEFVAALRHNLNDSITRNDAAAMLSQHLITKPVFDALFGGQEFTERNPVSRVMQRMVNELEGYGLAAETAELAEFYASVRRRVEGIDNAEGKQHVIVELYERFFKVAYPKVAESLGIVYTPVEIVDFIIRSVRELLHREFDASLSDEGVHILDPFVGTGTFITRLLQSGFIDQDALLRKYASELHANEIMLLAYYVAAVNIETANAQIAGEYQPFEGIVLTDTFQASEASDRTDTTFFPRNNARIERQLGLDIRVIISNPPWSSGQSSYEDDNANQRYPTLDDKIARSYIASSDSKGLKSSLYDSYVRAIRWASDRVQAGDGGIVGFVTNRGFLDGKSSDGFRKTLTKEFHEVYVYDLRGNQRTSGETSQMEGGKVFGSGSRAGVVVLLLVKRPGPATGPAAIHYYDIGDYLSREQKLEVIGKAPFDEIEWTDVTPNDQGDWINQRSDAYLGLRPVAVIQSESAIPSLTPLFESSSFGVTSRRDAWVFNSSGNRLREMVERQVAFYNEQVHALQDGADAVESDPMQFKWDLAAEQRAKRHLMAEVRPSGFRSAIYRPYFRQHFYMERALTSALSQIPTFFPAPDIRNPTIFVERGLRAPGRAPAALAVDAIPDIAAGAGASGLACQVLPRYTYVEPTDTPQGELLPVEPHRQDNISGEALDAYRDRYGRWVTKDHIFAYVYGILHSPDYREQYASDLATLSTDATLSGLSLGTGVTLSPAFASGTATYTASVANSVDEVTVTATTNHASATVEILDTDDNELDDADDVEDGFQVALSVGSTQLGVLVTAEDGTTRKLYTVNVTRDDFPNDTTTTTGQVEVGGSVTGTGGTLDRDWFKVVLEAGTRYQIDLEGADTGRGTVENPAASMFDAGGTYLPQQDDSDSGVGNNARIIYTPTATGTYHVQTWNISAVKEGTYTLSVIVLGANGASEADTDFPNTIATTGRVDVGASATGNIENSNGDDWFRVDLEEGKTYQFDLEGVDTSRGMLDDPYLGLFDGSGTYLFDDHDDGTGLNSRITHTPATGGTYYLRAARAGTSAGTYTLSVRDITQPPPCTLNTGDLWCGVVTVAEVKSNADALVGHGFADGAGLSAGSLAGYPDDTMFSIGDNDYTIQGAYVQVPTGANLTGTLYVLLTADLTDADKAGLLLPVDGTTTPFEFSGATKSTTGLYSWGPSGLTWSAGDTVTIRVRPRTLSVADASDAENDGEVEFTLTLSEAAATAVTATWTASIETGNTAVSADLGETKTGTVTVAIGDTTGTFEVPVVNDATSGMDFTAASGTLTIAAADNTATGTIEVQTTEDDASESEETFTLTLSNPSNATLGTKFTATGMIVNLATPGAPTGLSATAGNRSVALAWNAPASDADITRHEYRYKTDGRYPDTWKKIPYSATGEFNADGFTVTKLDNDTAHTFQLHAVNDDGVSAAVESSAVTPSGSGDVIVSITMRRYDGQDGEPYGVGDEIVFVVEFSRNVANSTNPGNEKVRFDIGSTRKDAGYYSGGVGKKLWYKYTIGEGDVDSDGIEIPAGPTALPETYFYSSDNDDEFDESGIRAQGPFPDRKVDGVYPTLDSAAVNGTELVLTWDETLRDDSGPAAGDFAVTVAGSSRSVSGVAVAGSAVRLTLASAVTAGQTVTVSYTKGTNPLKDLASNDAPGLTDQAVTNNTAPPDEPTLSIADAAAAEGDDLSFTVTLSAAAPEDVTVDWTASIESGSSASTADLATTKTGTVTITKGATTKKFTVPVNDDTTDEPDQTFTVTLSNPTPTSLAQLAADPTATGTIEDDDDPPTLTVADLRHDEGETSAWMTVSLSEVSEKRVRFKLRQVDRTDDTASDADWVPLSSDAFHSLSAGTMSGNRLAVYIVRDTLDEDDETLTVEAYSLDNATGSAADREATITIVDDDPTPTVTVADAAATEGDKVEFVVTLSAVSGRDVDVDYATSVATGDGAVSGTDFTAASGTLTIAAADNTATGTIEVQTTEDDASESAETFTLTISSPDNATLTTDTTATGTINNRATTAAEPTTFAAAVGNAQVVLSWDAPDSASGVTRHEYQYKEGIGAYQGWERIANSGVGGANEDGFTVTGLTNEVLHTFQLRAVNAQGESTAAEADPVTPTPGICDRTQQVQDALLEFTVEDYCKAVTVADLAGVTLLNISLQALGVSDITALKSGDFGGLTGLTNLTVADQQGLTTLPSDIFSGLSKLTTLALVSNQLNSLPSNVFSDLTKLEILTLGENELTSPLPAGLFDGLTALEMLFLDNNELSSLPAGLFDDPTALTSLQLQENKLSSLPPNVFSGLAALETLTLNFNDLTSLPDGLFSGLTALTTLILGDNPNSGDTLALTVTVEKSGTDQARAKVLTGAPFAVDFTATVANGSLPTGVTKLAVAAGSVDGTAVTVTRTSGTMAAVTVDIDLTTQPTPPANHTGYEFVKAASGLPAEILPDTRGPQNFTAKPGDGQAVLAWTAPASGSGVTKHQYRQKEGTGSYPATWTDIPNSAEGGANEDGYTVPGLTNETVYTFELKRFVGTTESATAESHSVTVANLAGIGGLSVENKGVTSLKAGDFASLTGMTTLNLTDNSLSSLPAGVFSGLSALITLKLNDNDLSSLDAGVFSGLSALGTLELQENDLETLPSGLFSGLTALTGLNLSDNTTNPMLLTVTVEKVGTDRVRAKVLAGAPFAVAIPVTPANGTLAGDVTVLTVAKGSVESAAVTVTRTEGTTDAVTVDVDLSTQPSRPGFHLGYIFARAASGLPAEILPEEASLEPPTGLAATPGDRQAVLTWTPPASDSGFTRHQYRYRTGGSWEDWTDIPDSGPNETNATRYTVTELDNAVEYRFELRARDAATVRVTPTGPPRILSVEVTSGPGLDGDTYGAGEEVDISVTFDQPVVVEGAPQLVLDVDGSRLAEYHEGSGSNTLVFAYVVTESDRDTDGVSVGDNALRLDGGDVIRNGAGDNAELAHDGTGEQPGHMVNGGRRAGVHDHGEFTHSHSHSRQWYPEHTHEGHEHPDDANGHKRRPGTHVHHAQEDLNAGISGGPDVRTHDGVEHIHRCFDLKPSCNQGDDYAERGDELGLPIEVTHSHEHSKPGHGFDWRAFFEEGGSGATVSVADAVAVRGEGRTLDFEVSLEPAVAFAVRVDYATVDGTATAGEDYLGTSGVLEIPPGQTRATVSVRMPADGPGDGPELFELRLRSATAATVADVEATGTILMPGPSTPPVIERIAVASTPRLSSDGNTNRDTYGEGETIRIEVRFDQPVVVVGDPTFALAVGDPCESVCEADYESGSGADTLVFAYLVLEVDVDRNGIAIHGNPIEVVLGDSIRNAAGQEARLSSKGKGTQRNHRVNGSRSAAAHLSVADAEAHEADGEMTFTVRLEPHGLGIVTVDYATRGGSARAGEDYTATGGTLRFNSLETERTVTVPITDDTVPDDGDTFTLRLSNPDGAKLRDGDGEATGTIHNSEPQEALTASFEDVPAAHDGAAFRFRVAFSEDIGISFQALREDAFAVTNGRITNGVPVDDRRDLFDMTLEPDGDGDVAVTLEADRDCAESGAICTKGEPRRRLTTTVSAMVAGPDGAANAPATGAPAIIGTVQVGETLTADTSGIADANGLTNVSYNYQWLADDADIAGATGYRYTLADSDEGRTIRVRVTFTDDAGNEESLTSAATAAVAGSQPTEPPARPTGLSATASHDSVTLTWDDPGDDSITGYVILRRVRVNNTGGDFSELVADTGTAATTYTDDTVAAGTTYTYRIKAINGAGTSERSRWFHIDTPAAPVPDKPTGLSATASHDSVTLTWEDPGDDSITGYVILRRLRYDDPSGHFDELVADTGTAATTYTDDTVKANTHYTYRIKAINGAGVSERSRWFHIHTQEAP